MAERNKSSAAKGPLVPFLFSAIAALAPFSSPAASHGAGLDDIPICHGFGCRNKETASISEAEWKQIKAFFSDPAESPKEEREQIRKAAGWFEVVIGRHTPIHLDKGKNEYPGRIKTAGPATTEDGPNGTTVGQMDCIDESLNTTTYLTLMEKAGLFRYHRVVERAHRKSAFDQHYAGQIEELRRGARWVVDSWFYDYGSLPYVEEATEWYDIPYLFSTSFPE
ncbi:MAG: hypothetical protein MAG794_00441 [Gammaproteobacteria bacterium]|nr:hypothetical protein [Gammaproteobacteria bacterium]